MATLSSSSPDRLVRGMVLVTLSALGFSCMHAVVRLLSAELHPFEIAFFRNLFGLLVVVPFFLRDGRAVLRSEQLPWHLLRGALQVFGMLMFFTALGMTPLAQVSALSFTAPLFATVGAIIVLGERLRLRRLVALVLGFAGALVILRPGVVPVDLGSLLVLGSSLAWAFALLVIKHVSRTESSVTLTAYMGLILTPLSLVPALFVWRWPGPEALVWLVVLGTVGGSSQLAMAEAFRGADASAVLPFDFTRLLWASLLGFLVFEEVPGLHTWIGGAIIFASTTYIAYREAREEARSPARPELATANGSVGSGGT